MKNTESPERVMSRLLEKIVAYAGALGELKYRHTLIEEEIEQIDLTVRSGCSALSKKKKAGRTTESAVLAVHREYRRSIQEHSKYLSRTRFLLQVEFEQIGRLKDEIQNQLAETIGLLKKTAYILEKTAEADVARPLRRPNPYVLRSETWQAPV